MERLSIALGPMMLEPAQTAISNEEAERLRKVYNDSFPSECDENGEEQNFDWSLTLTNIEQLSGAARSAVERLEAAELRAERAERRAAEALHWLRRLHQAVLDGMPTTTAAKAPLSTVRSDGR